MAFIDGTVVNVALPALQTNLNATAADVQWVIESYALLLSALLLVGGSLGDHYGRRRVFVLGVVIFAVASGLCGLAGNIRHLIAARAIQGFGAALLVPGSLAIISNSFPEQERGRAIGVWSGFSAITTGIGPVLGGWLIEHVSWRAVFFINLPLALVVILISLRHVAENSDRETTRVDWLGAILAALGLGALIYGLIESSQVGFEDRSVIVALAAGLSCFDSVFVRRIAPFVANVAAEIVSFANVCRNESPDFSALCCSWRNTFFPTVEFDSGSALFADCRRSGAVAVHTNHVVPFALVRRTCCALRSKNSTHRWPAYRSGWLFALLAAGDWRQLLDKFFPTCGCSGIRHGRYCGAAYHDRDELAGTGSRRRRIGSEQRRRAHSKSRGDCSFWSRDGPRFQNQSGSHIDRREFADFCRAIGTNSIDQAGSDGYSAKSRPGETTVDPSRNRRVFCVWISLGHSYWRRARRGERSYCTALD